MKIILASSSIHRQKQLQELKIPFEAINPLFDEDSSALKKTISDPGELALRLGYEKAKSLFNKDQKNNIIVGSDQILFFKEQILNKPKIEQEVFDRLLQLQGKKHSLYTSLVVITAKQTFKHIDQTDLSMNNITDNNIREYIKIDQPIGCAGGYKFEKNGFKLFNKINSKDTSSITGLPTIKLISLLKEIGFKYE